MRKVVLDLAVSLDGFIEGPNGEVDWCIMDDDMAFDRFLSGIDTIFYGRASYDRWGNFQPGEKASETERMIWTAVHSKVKYVVSTKASVDEHAIFITSPVATTVYELKNQPGKDIWLYGGAGLVSTFIELGLIDLFRLSIHPVVLGNGKPLFTNLKRRVGLNLVQTSRFRSGVVQHIYEPLTF